MLSDSEPFSAVHPKFRNALLRRGFTELTAVQRAVLAAGAHGENLRISSETGSGKTVALGLVIAADLIEGDAKSKEASSPEALLSKLSKPEGAGPRALVITPTRELANQVADELRWLYSDLRDVRVDVVTGGTDLRRDRQNLARDPTILVGTPGRLCDHLRSGTLRCSNVCEVVLDEADQMLDMGFKDELDAIVLELPAQRRSHLVSATFPMQVKKLAHRFQGEAVMIHGTELGVANADIEHVAHLVRPHDIYSALVNLLLLARGERTLVFVKRRIDAGEVSERLVADGFTALPLSGELPQEQRTRTLNAFRSGTVTTLIATDVAARGIDVPDIANVIHLEPPLDPETYTHRSGRTGRAGRKGRSISLVAPIAEARVSRLLQAAGVEVAWLPVPSVAQIKKAVTKQGRANFHHFLKTGPAPSEAELEYARQLLEKEDAARVVAVLLQLSEPKLPHEPVDIAPVAPRHGAAALSKPASGPAPRQAREAPASRAAEQGFVHFVVNWGQKRGANPSRVLAMLCKRGNIKGDCIGAIEIEANRTSFGVREEVAARFEASAGKVDPLQPDLKIERYKAHAGAVKKRSSAPSEEEEAAPPRAKRAYAPKAKAAAPRAKRAYAPKAKAAPNRRKA